jgi:hypothetical protein
MNLVSDLDPPAFDYTASDFSADRYHQQLAETVQQGWLAKSPLAYIVLDHDSGEFFLRSRVTAFPGRQIAEFFGVTGGPLADHIDANILNLTGEEFDITATRDARLLTFGAGTHFCLGSNLARAELEEALAFLAPRSPDLALDGPPQLGGVEGIYGIDKLPIIWSGSAPVSSGPEVT